MYVVILEYFYNIINESWPFKFKGIKVKQGQHDHKRSVFTPLTTIKVPYQILGGKIVKIVFTLMSSESGIRNPPVSHKLPGIRNPQFQCWIGIPIFSQHKYLNSNSYSSFFSDKVDLEQ